MLLTDRLYYAFIAIFGAVVFLMVFGACAAPSALACGDTPGFCTNPPATHKPMDYPQCYAPKSTALPLPF